MDRNQAKALLPIIQAYAEGKVIQIQHIDGTWQDAKYLNPGRGLIYRIKPEPKYRPFKDSEECWCEMSKHEPFGWVKNKGSQALFVCKAIGCIIEIGIEDTPYTYKHQFDTYTFADGTPFGIKEEE